VYAPKVFLGLVSVALLVLPGTGEAQRGGGRFGAPIRVATAADYDAAFQFCRVAFRGGGWGVDYPQADTNLSIRLSELTKTPVSFDQRREPNHLVVQLTDDALFQCPFVMMTEVGRIFLDDDEVTRLRAYLLKGGFLWADDFWGSREWFGWESEIRKVFPAAQYPIVELPMDHPMFRMQFVVTRVPQIPSILDPDGRLMVLMTHNTDFGDSWEREGDDPNYFYAFAVDGYAFGINVLLYSMTY
jgi:hypothetical protein